MNCQVKTLRAAKETGNDIVAEVKNSQEILLSDCIKTSEIGVK